MASKTKGWKFFVIATLVAVLSWSIFDLARTALTNAIENLGIVNPYAVNLLLIGLILVILTIFGLSFKKTLRRALG